MAVGVCSLMAVGAACADVGSANPVAAGAETGGVSGAVNAPLTPSETTLGPVNGNLSAFDSGSGSGSGSTADPQTEPETDGDTDPTPTTEPDPASSDDADASGDGTGNDDGAHDDGAGNDDGADDDGADDNDAVNPEPGDGQAPEPLYEEPVRVAAAGAALDSAWADYERRALTLASVELLPAPSGFSPFNRAVVLPDGRHLVRGRWDGDVRLEVAWQHQPTPDQPSPPVTEQAVIPIRLFVVAGDGTFRPVSHIPVVRDYQTATSSGTTADVVLDIAVVEGSDGLTVAYLVGFNGAAYDMPRELWLAPIPPA